MRLATVEEAFGAAVASLDQLLSREQIGRGKVVLNGVERVVVLLNRGRSVDVGDEMRPLVVAAFGHLDFVAHPLQTPLAAVAHIAVVGRTQPLADRWAFLRRETTGMTVGDPVLLRPRLRERLGRWQWLQPVHPRLRRLLHTGQQVVAVIADALAQRLALPLVFGRFAVALCERQPQVCATILDLPDAGSRSFLGW
jgi:hypothetical protein